MFYYTSNIFQNIHCFGKKGTHYTNLTSNIVFIWQLRFFHLTTSYYKHFYKCFYKHVSDDSFYKPKYVVCNLALKYVK
jgi:hypothetical protein